MECAYEKYIILSVCILNKLKFSIDQGEVEKDLVGFSPEAKRYWIALYNEIEYNLQQNGRFQYARDHGSKLAENIARIAALLTYIELGEGEDIPLGILMDAANIAFYFSDTYLILFQVLPEYQTNNVVLNEFFQSLREDGDRYIRKNKVRQSGPIRIRSKSILDQSLASLSQYGDLSMLVCDNGMVVIDLYPSRPFDQSQWDSFCYKNKLSTYIRP